MPPRLAKQVLSPDWPVQPIPAERQPPPAFVTGDGECGAHGGLLDRPRGRPAAAGDGSHAAGLGVAEPQGQDQGRHDQAVADHHEGDGGGDAAERHQPGERLEPAARRVGARSASQNSSSARLIQGIKATS